MKKILIPLAAMLLTACSEKPVNYQADITTYLNDATAAVSFTYDDGMLCHYTDIAPELEKRGFRGTFWIIGANMDKDDLGYPWMSWDQVAELAKRGHEIANHTWNHPNLTSLPAEQVEWELAQCDSVIEAKVGKKPISMAYPYNAMSPEVVALCEKGRVGTRTFQDGQGEIESHCTPESMCQWLDSLITEGKWGVTMTHGTTYGWDMWLHPENLYAFYDVVKAKGDSVWVGTFAEVMAYTKERDNSLLVVSRNANSVTINLRHSLDAELFTQPLTVCVKGADWTGKNPVAKQGENSVAVVNRGESLLVNVVPSADPVLVTW